MKKAALIVLATATVATTAFTKNIDHEVLKRLEKLEALVHQQQLEIEQLRSQNRQLDQIVRSENTSAARLQSTVELDIEEGIQDSGFAQVKDAYSDVTLRSHIDRLKWESDLRLRGEYRDRDDADPDTRTRFRQRVRLGTTWTSEDENWEVAVGLASGGNSPTSTNDTFSDNEVFESGDIRIDYAYATHRWQTENGRISLALGQQKNPFRKGTTKAMWDGDLRPVGVSISGTAGAMFGHLGVFDVFDSAGADEAEGLMIGGQLGMDFEGDNLDGRVALGYYTYNDEAVDHVAEDPTLNLGGIDASKYEYDIFDVYGSLQTDVGEVGLTLYGHYIQNTGADGQSIIGVAGEQADDNDSTYVLGLKAKVEAFELGYAYHRHGADATYQPVVDSDFGTGMTLSDSTGATAFDVKGHELTAKYKFTKHMSLGITALMYEEIEGGSDEAELYQLDVVYKF